MRFANKILLNFLSTTLHARAFGRPRGRAKAHGRSRAQDWRESQWRFFPMPFWSNAGSVNRSPAQKSMPPLCAAPHLQPTVVLKPSAPSTFFGPCSQIELAQGSSDTSEDQLELIASLLFDRYLLTSYLSNPNQDLCKVEQDFLYIMVVKRGLVSPVDL